jgi:23S rRNA pseudouridine1911/1915/1917 synthase
VGFLAGDCAPSLGFGAGVAGLASASPVSTSRSLSDVMTAPVYPSTAGEPDSLDRESDSLRCESDSLWIDILLAVDDACTGYRLDRFLAERIRRLSRTRIQSIIAAGHVHRLGAGAPPLPMRAATRVHAGETVRLRRPAPLEPLVPMHADVVHQEDELLVLDKPAGLPVHPSARYHRSTLTAVLRRDFGPDHGWRMAHRLDRETSGVMVFGRRGTTDSLLKRAFQERRVHKEYLAIVQGTVQGPARIDIPLGPASGSRVRIKMGPRSHSDGGLVACTDLEPLAVAAFRGQPVTLVRASPRTGRQHQIRVHLAELGHPIVGDKLYGIDEQAFLDVADHVRLMSDLEAELGLSRQALHAFAITIPHPTTGRDVRFTAPWPPELASIVDLP